MRIQQHAITLSEQILYHVKTAKPSITLETELQNISLSDFISEINTDDKKKTFWINVYNAFYQIIIARKQNSSADVYRERGINIATEKFSLDDIEHGILRRYRSKYGLGYVSQLFPSKLIKKLSVSIIDFRIHFALNCGAQSCPPIAFYKVDTIDNQLDLATASYLENESEINEQHKVILISELIRWFRADFGGTTGIKNMLNKYLNKDFTTYSIKYKSFRWDKKLNNFQYYF